MYVQEIGAEFVIYSNKNLSTTLIMYVQKSGAEFFIYLLKKTSAPLS